MDARGRDPRQHDYCQFPQARPCSSPGKPPAVFTPTWKAASGWLDPQQWVFSDQAWTSRYSQSDPCAGDARAVTRPKPGPGRGARKRCGADVGGRDSWKTWLLPGFPGSAKFVSWEATSSLHAHLDGCFGAAGHTPVALFGPSMDDLVQPIRPPGQERLGLWIDLSRAAKRGQEEGQGLRWGT